MKRALKFPQIFLIILSILTLSMHAQNNDRWRAGSAKDLSGEVLYLVCYISTPGDSWSKQEKDEMLSKVCDAENWLTLQAEKFSVGITFENVLLNEGNDIIFDTIEPGLALGKERVDWVFRVLKKLGYKNAKQAYRRIKKKYETDNNVVLIMSKVGGRSYSMRYAKGYSKKKYFMEGAIIYHNYPNGALIPLAAVIAHELLHLYGAWDLYTTYAQTIERQQKAQELYPNDIMLRVDHNNNSLNINNLTAWLIGWNKKQEDIFEWFRPSDYKP